jgi:hypothetical protein
MIRIFALKALIKRLDFLSIVFNEKKKRVTVYYLSFMEPIIHSMVRQS